jgi:hypothetical protein
MISRTSAFVFLLALLPCCASGPARNVAVVPSPADPELTHVAGLSRVAATRVLREVEERGYAAILPDAEGRPETCRLAGDPGGADLAIYVWVQQVDLPRAAPDDDPVTHGGILLRDADGKDLAKSTGLLETPGAPMSSLYAVGRPDDPRSIAAADAFGTSLLRSLGIFAKAVSSR